MRSTVEPHADIERRSNLYRHSGTVPFASRLSSRARQAVYRRFVETLRPGAADTVLDIGVTCDAKFPESNFFERFYPHKHRITGVGTEDGSHLEQLYPGLRFVPVVTGERLPFPARHFHIAFSNAVIEHVGDVQRQRFFIAEALRVSKRFFIVTPNRWFPVETHSGLPLLHYLPPGVFRAMVRRTRFSFWADEHNLNLLTVTSLAHLFPAGTNVTVEQTGIGLSPFKSNLIAWGFSDPRGD